MSLFPAYFPFVHFRASCSVHFKWACSTYFTFRMPCSSEISIQWLLRLVVASSCQRTVSGHLCSRCSIVCFCWPQWLQVGVFLFPHLCRVYVVLQWPVGCSEYHSIKLICSIRLSVVHGPTLKDFIDGNDAEDSDVKSVAYQLHVAGFSC